MPLRLSEKKMAGITILPTNKKKKRNRLKLLRASTVTLAEGNKPMNDHPNSRKHSLNNHAIYYILNVYHVNPEAEYELNDMREWMPNVERSRGDPSKPIAPKTADSAASGLKKLSILCNDGNSKWKLTSTYKDRLKTLGPLSPNEFSKLWYTHGEGSVKAYDDTDGET